MEHLLRGVEFVVSSTCDSTTARLEGSIHDMCMYFVKTCLKYACCDVAQARARNTLYYFLLYSHAH